MATRKRATTTHTRARAASRAKTQATKPAKPAKSAKPTKPATATKPAKAILAPPSDAAPMPPTDAAPGKRKVKRIHGTFAMPQADYARIGKLKATGKRTGLKIKKNELFRLGLQALQTVTASELHDLVLALRLPEARRGK